MMLVTLICSALPGRAQERHAALELGGVLDTGGGNRAGYLKFKLQPASTQRCRSTSTIDLRPVANSQVAYAPQTGVECTVLKAGQFEFTADALGGLATNSEDTSAIFTTGPALVWRPKFAAGLGIVIGYKPSFADVQGGWGQQLRFGAEYNIE